MGGAASFRVVQSPVPLSTVVRNILRYSPYRHSLKHFSIYYNVGRCGTGHRIVLEITREQAIVSDNYALLERPAAAETQATFLTALLVDKVRLKPGKPEGGTLNMVHRPACVPGACRQAVLYYRREESPIPTHRVLLAPRLPAGHRAAEYHGM